MNYVKSCLIITMLLGVQIGYSQDCADDEFECYDGTCIPESLECDGSCDCGSLDWYPEFPVCNDESWYPCICTVPMGDLNGDGMWNVLDIVILANCVIDGNCFEEEYACAGDVSYGGGWNILDIVILANCVLSESCGP